MAAITPGSTSVELNGVTAVTVVAAPAAATYRTVLSLRVFNLDTLPVDLTLQTNIGGTKKTFEKILGLPVGGVWRPIDRDHIKNLVAVNVSLEIFMGAAVTTTAPHVEAEHIDKS